VCGRFTQERPVADLADLFEAELLVEDPGARFNVAPTDVVPVVVQHAGRRAITAYRWGLVPSWATDVRVGSRMINARAETVGSSPSFRDSFRRRRCIVPADAFYEWERAGGRARPFMIRRRDGRPLAFAGLWSSWHAPDVPVPLRTFTIVTTTPNELIAPLHDRMPVVLPPERWSTWLDEGVTDLALLRSMLVPAPAEELTLHAVGALVNDVRNEGPELAVPAPATPEGGADPATPAGNGRRARHDPGGRRPAGGETDGAPTLWSQPPDDGAAG